MAKGGRILPSAAAAAPQWRKHGFQIMSCGGLTHWQYVFDETVELRRVCRQGTCCSNFAARGSIKEEIGENEFHSLDQVFPSMGILQP